MTVEWEYCTMDLRDLTYSWTEPSEPDQSSAFQTKYEKQTSQLQSR